VSSTGAQLDILEGAAEPEPRRRVRNTALLIVAALLAAGAWSVDHHRRVAEFDRLTGCVQAGESAATYVSSRIWGAADYIRPAFRPGISPDLRAGLFELVREQAAIGTPDLIQARERCRAERPQRWHTALGRARTSYLAYLDARLAIDQGIALDGSQVYVQHPELADLHDRAAGALGAAAPDGGAARRVRSLLSGPAG
jgi:hypothetical protein